MLMDLPKPALVIIARKMGKRARLLCSTLCQVYGSPGSVLNADRVLAGVAPQGHGFFETYSPPMLQRILSWRYPEAITRLELGFDVFFDGPDCRTLTTALPNLRELTCRRIFPEQDKRTDRAASLASLFKNIGNLGAKLERETIEITPHTALTSLRVMDVFPDTQGHLCTFAPNLRTLYIESFMCTQGPHYRPWETLVAVPSSTSLQRLHMPLITMHLMDEGFTAVTQHLSNLTCLELECMDGLSPASERSSVPADSKRLFAEGLAALPLLARIKLDCFRSLSPVLGPALQALSGLTSLEMNEFGSYNWDPSAGRPTLEGCFPDFSAMPSLQHLALNGDQIIGSKELRKMYSTGSASIKSLELRGMQYKQLQAACELLGVVSSALTNLVLWVKEPDARGSERSQHDQPLRQAVARHTQLQRLDIRAGLHSFVPWLATLPGLTQLTLVFDHTGVLEADLEVVGRLAGLKKLELGSFGKARGRLQGGIAAVRKLPVLEELQLRWEEQWTEQEVGLLLPPPERLQQLALASSSSSVNPSAACLQAMHKLELYGVEVRMQRVRR
jgi:hypothetical protein